MKASNYGREISETASHADVIMQNNLTTWANNWNREVRVETRLLERNSRDLRRKIGVSRNSSDDKALRPMLEILDQLSSITYILFLSSWFIYDSLRERSTCILRIFHVQIPCTQARCQGQKDL